MCWRGFLGLAGVLAATAAGGSRGGARADGASRPDARPDRSNVPADKPRHPRRHRIPPGPGLPLRRRPRGHHTGLLCVVDGELQPEPLAVGLLAALLLLGGLGLCVRVGFGQGLGAQLADAG
jgi:hypothetical protein